MSCQRVTGPTLPVLALSKDDQVKAALSSPRRPSGPTSPSSMPSSESEPDPLASSDTESDANNRGRKSSYESLRDSSWAARAFKRNVCPATPASSVGSNARWPMTPPWSALPPLDRLSGQASRIIMKELLAALHGVAAVLRRRFCDSSMPFVNILILFRNDWSASMRSLLPTKFAKSPRRPMRPVRSIR